MSVTADSNDFPKLLNQLQASATDLQISVALLELEERCLDVVVSREALFELLSAIQKIIDSSSKRNPEACDFLASDISKSHALTAYTSIVIQFDELAEPIRAQFTQALVDMVFRSNVKRRDYVNSFLRRTACECLTELEEAFPSEVAAALQLGPWLSAQSATTPAIVAAVQEEPLWCFENYAKLLLACCRSGPANDKALMKIVSLLLDALEFSSVWVRGYVAAAFPALIARITAPEWTNAVVLHHFARLLDSPHAHQLHAFFCVSRQFVSDWDSALTDSFVDRVFRLSLHTSEALPVRQLSLLWLADLLEHPRLRVCVYAGRHQLVPRLRSDPSHLIEQKLQTLLRFAESVGAVPRRPLAALAGAPPTAAIYRFLARILNQFSPHFDQTELFAIPQFLTEMLQSSAACQPCVIGLCESLTTSKRVKTELLKALASFLLNAQPPSRVIAYFPLAAYLATQPGLAPASVVGALTRCLDSCDSLGWSEGLKILELSRLVVLTHGDAAVPALRPLLARLTAVGSVDSVERAQLLSRFLGALDVDERRAFLVPRAAALLTEPLEKETRESTASSSGVSTPAVPLVVMDKILTSRQALGVQDGHWGCYTEEDSVELPFSLRCDPAAGDQELFGIELSFSVSPYHAPFSAVTIPYLKGGTGTLEGAMAGAGSGFPFEYTVLLRLRPLEPVPAVFSVGIVFTDQHGASHTGALEPFKIALEDMFVPCLNSGAVWAAKWRNPFAKLIPMKRDRVERLIAQRLGPFLLDDESVLKNLPQVPEFDFQHELLMHGLAADAPAAQREKAVIISLPPAYHLMMRFVMGSHSSVVWIDTDRVEILALLDQFFAQWAPTS